ncbi:MAG: family 10 glycosylhydrolase [Bacilli bacterium]|nr:family 10 glycosylhydrolase [Bacilli bacterium]
MKTKYLYFFITIVFSLFLISCNDNDVCEDPIIPLNQYNITFIDGEREISIKLDEGSIIKATPNIYDDETKVFVGWYDGDTLFDFNNCIYKDLILVSKYKYFISFVDEDGSLLSTQFVIEGNDAVLPELDEKEDKKFFCWSSDYTNITESKILKAIYTDNDGFFHINYSYNGLNKEYKNKEEMLSDFLEDFYDFINPKENKILFMHGYQDIEATWTKYLGGSFSKINKLIKDNDIDLIDDNYFLNSNKYKDKWYPLASYVRDYICKQNKRFGYNDVNYYHGALDFYRYLIEDPNVYIDTYGGEEVFHSLPEFYNEMIKYKFGDNVNLPLIRDPLFDGWYFDSDFINQASDNLGVMVGNIDLYAKKNDKKTAYLILDYGYNDYKDYVKLDGSEILLPNASRKGYEFQGWYMNYYQFEGVVNFDYDVDIRLDARWHKIGEINYNYLIYDNQVITYEDQTPVELPDTYVEKDELRAVWISSFIKCYSPSNDETTMKEELNKVLDLLDYYKFNCVFFHLRTHNNAFYPTDLAPIKAEYGTKEDFETFNYLPWFIEECHKRGIEFHAWLNPYRISLSGLPLNTTVDDVSNKYADYPLNPASNSDNILLTVASDNGSLGAILNPEKQEVIDYINDVVLELLDNYDIDGIHFDDYFYHRLLNKDRNIEDKDILNDPDQEAFIEFINEHSEYGFSENVKEDKEEWRRMNVNRLISLLHDSISNYNKTKNKNVLFGISPTGVYRTGDGDIESGALVHRGGHYTPYTFCDSLKWIKEGWIDYILPQCYTSFNNPEYKFHEIVSWWNKVAKAYPDCKVYIGFSITKSIDNEYNYSWKTEEDELINQLLLLQTMDGIDGVCLYSFTALIKIHEDETVISHNAFEKMRNELWVNKVTFR